MSIEADSPITTQSKYSRIILTYDPASFGKLLTVPSSSNFTVRAGVVLCNYQLDKVYTSHNYLVKATIHPIAVKNLETTGNLYKLKIVIIILVTTYRHTRLSYLR